VTLAVEAVKISTLNLVVVVVVVVVHPGIETKNNLKRKGAEMNILAIIS
jgi:hypothetical protein